jgi:membrane-associated protein
LNGDFISITLIEGGGFIHRFIEWIIQNGGLYLLIFIVFAETGLFVGFFLPGDSLLFAAGIYLDDLAKEFFDQHYVFVLLACYYSICFRKYGRLLVW